MILIEPYGLIALEKGQQLSPPHFFGSGLDNEGASAAGAGKFVNVLSELGRKNDVGPQCGHIVGPLPMGLRQV